MAATRLYFTASIEEQWQSLAGPWLREQAKVAWKNPKPTVILTPSRAESFYLRSRLVSEGVPFLGLRFWTPSDARKILLAEMLPGLGAATLAEQRLVARACAERLAPTAAAENATLTSVIRDPGAFLRAYDLLLGAGWNPASEGAVYGRDLAREFQRTTEKLQIATQAGLHRQLRRAIPAREEPLLANLLVVGFNAAHWPLWDLVQAVAASAEEAVIALTEPRFFAEEIDQLWISSWEELTKSEVVIPSNFIDLFPSDDPAPPFAELIAAYEQGATGSGADVDLTFCVTPDLASQTRGIVLQALAYLKNDSCTRLEIVFPEANALALGVAHGLRRLGVPLDDGTGWLTPGPFEQSCWQSWIALQEEPGVPRLIAWLRACEAQGTSCGVPDGLSARTVANLLDEALGESLVDDLNFLALHLDESSKKREAAAVAEFLRERMGLPEEATFARFLEMTRHAISLPGWERHLERLQIDPPAWLLKYNETLTRRTFLEWLKESTDSRTWSSGAEGNHFYGKVHLTLYSQMTGQTWSHLILTGLNEGVWPRMHEAGAFGSRHELTELNQQARQLNLRSQEQGGQGMGHETVSADHAHCLLPLERQDLALRDLCAALESTSVAACLAAMTTEDGRSLLPSDFFNHAYQFKTGRVLDDETFRNVASASLQYNRRHNPLFQTTAAVAESEIAATRIAYAVRRDETQPFGPYEFAYAEPPPRPIQLSCKTWEDAWSHPATTWLEEIVGASSWPDGTLSWPRAIGTWVHRWLAAALRDCRERNSTAEFPVLIWAAADHDAQTAQNRARLTGIELYPWWKQVWGRAKTRSLQLGESLAPLLPDHFFLPEFKLPGNLMFALPGSGRPDFQLKGRIDFIQVTPAETVIDLQAPNFSGRECWVIDFKTGSSKSLTPKSVLKGTGLQAILYALAVRALGAESTSVSLLAPDSEARKQITLNASLDPILASLDKLHRAGVFGMRADAETGYGFSPGYPIATQFASPNILEAKWTLTHGEFEP